MINVINGYKNITTATTTQIFSDACTLERIVVNTTSGGSIVIIDNTTGSTPTVGTLKANIAEGTYWYGVTMSKGIRIITNGASDITVVWRARG